jgi:drug/metabolite transporter (DMT)-like permease
MGYLAAAGCALTWALYSVLSRRFRDVPTAVVAGFCIATAILSALAHLLFERTNWPETATQWMAVLALGLLPVGAAFYVWDHGVKRGDIQLLGASSYLAPLLSTAALTAAGFGAFSGRVLLAAILITGGAALASRDLLVSVLLRRAKARPAAR